MSLIFRLLILCCCVNTAGFAVGMGNEMGLFCLQVQGFINTNRAVTLDNPACYAMSSKKVITMIVLIDEAINNQTYMNYLKKLTIEPYVYGIDRNQQPVLCGNITRVEILKQQSVRFGTAQVVQDFGGLNAKFTAMIIWKQPPAVGPVNVWKVLDVQVNNSASYMARPEVMQSFPTTGLNVICSTLPITAPTQSAQPFEQQTYPQTQTYQQPAQQPVLQPVQPTYQQPAQQTYQQQVPQYQYPQQPANSTQQQLPAQQYQQPQQQQPLQQQQSVQQEKYKPYVPPKWDGPNY